VRYEERGQGYRDVEKVGKHWSELIRWNRTNVLTPWLYGLLRAMAS